MNEHLVLDIWDPFALPIVKNSPTLITDYIVLMCCQPWHWICSASCWRFEMGVLVILNSYDDSIAIYSKIFSARVIRGKESVMMDLGKLDVASAELTVQHFVTICC
jgi:hypothetical protein